MNILKGKTGITAVIAVGLVLTSFLVAVKFLSGVVEEHYESVKTVCLDAGHGADDVGATSTGGARLEKDDNLRLTLKVKDRLEAKVKNCILMQDTVIEDGAYLEYVITDKNVRVSRNRSLTGNDSFQVYVAKGQTV